VKPIIITEESIKGYGYLLSESKKDPILNNDHFKYISDVYKLIVDGEMTVGILIGRKREMVLKNLERHKETIEILVQLENDSVVFFAAINLDYEGSSWLVALSILFFPLILIF
jgi:hypothetical protein